MLISSAATSRLAASYALALMPETAVITRPTGSANDSGGTTDGAPVTIATVAARIASADSGGARDDAGRRVVSDQWMLTFPAGTDVQTGDVVTIGARVFHVQGPDGGRSMELTRRVVATEVS